MEVCRRSSWLLLLLGVSLLATTLQGVQGEAESEGPSESECRPYIEKALKELETGDAGTAGTPDTGDSKEDVPTVEITTDDSDHQDDDGDDDNREEGTESIESVETDQNVEDKQSTEKEDTEEETDADGEEDADTSQEGDDASPEQEGEASVEGATDSKEESTAADEDEKKSEEDGDDGKSGEVANDIQESKEDQDTQEDTEDVAEQQGEAPESQEDGEKDDDDTEEDATAEQGDSVEDAQQASAEEEQQVEQPASAEDDQQASTEEEQQASAEKEQASAEEQQASAEEQQASAEDDQQASVEEGQQASADDTQEESVETGQDVKAQASQEGDDDDEDTKENDTAETTEDEQDEIETKSGDSKEKTEEESKENDQDDAADDDKSGSKEDETVEEQEQDGGSAEVEATREVDERSAEQDSTTSDEAAPSESAEDQAEQSEEDQGKESAVSEEDGDETEKSEEDGEDDSAPEEELSLDVEIPTDLRSRDHVEHLLKLDDEASETEKIINRVAEITLRELKKLYENAIKPLEGLYKYRDLSNRHFGDSEIFSKPLILFMGPWSGGKSSIINYLLDNEYNETSLKTGAEPSPAYFNILLHGDEQEIIDGTQLAADFTFSGLQKFGQGLEERLRGVKLPSKLLEKVNIVEIPGILEVRKQVSRVFPFNDACQWFIDRADIIFLVYDPSKLDVGPETEAILDQLKGREHQTRIILNKADQVKPEELMRVQGALIWNISPLMSSAQPPVMYTTSLWSRPYESWAPARLLQAQERAFLRDLRSAVDKRIENKIASARRFAVRVRNHAKMVDCYLTTYYNHKSVFGNRKQVADEIIEHPQDYHIYEGLSTLTNISRYDLPDPDVYRDFFKLNPLYEFQQLSATCTYFRGCPINRLDVAIAYDLPELVGKHKRLVESALAEANQTPVPGS